MECRPWRHKGQFLQERSVVEQGTKCAAKIERNSEGKPVYSAVIGSIPHRGSMLAERRTASGAKKSDKHFALLKPIYRGAILPLDLVCIYQEGVKLFFQMRAFAGYVITVGLPL
jgi:hypothetical protein